MTTRSPRIDGTIEERFWPKVDRSGGPDACWPWLARRDRQGYGAFAVVGEAKRAHRVAWELANGRPFPADLVADHLCRNTWCVNPDHVEPVTQRENLHRSPLTNAAKVACPLGHPYDAFNTYLSPTGRRMCRTCRRDVPRRPGPAAA